MNTEHYVWSKLINIYLHTAGDALSVVLSLMVSVSANQFQKALPLSFSNNAGDSSSAAMTMISLHISH